MPIRCVLELCLVHWLDPEKCSSFWIAILRHCLHGFKRLLEIPLTVIKVHVALWVVRPVYIHARMLFSVLRAGQTVQVKQDLNSIFLSICEYSIEILCVELGLTHILKVLHCLCNANCFITDLHFIGCIGACVAWICDPIPVPCW